MASLLPSFIGKAKVPLLGSVSLALELGIAKAKKAPSYAAWTVPAAAGALWFIWPAVGDETKIAWGIKSDPAADVVEAAPSVTVNDLDSSSKKAIENAYKSHGGESSPYSGPVVHLDPVVMAKHARGDFSDLQKDWDSFHREALIYNEDDEDDEEEEEEEEEEEQQEVSEEEGEEDEDEDE
mmetsp:Transcript_24658/g.35378  ORF Transcript_24658/g.35378 Transcript_24658/m.35378 type:complete len:181 (+) Transcript_24658:100-642(+)|eukprot:CAMPEP_0172420696 /NCGR_PEP_ID=MMETSP1064-20121228/7045_1 /TAXON_ID=202472 /ORGANISM="Aulacoseira subarctica , Strain CCAP 1002/5" /LENGTH=180 /DNA_ID=CAMNT_0013160769 /DNA_START=75 /DNA_END=617 /DNA_ORIENTATION=+